MEPEKLLDLIASYEGVRDSVSDFLQEHGNSLRGRPLADDEVSGDAAGVFTDHSMHALDVTERFLGELNANIEQLMAAAKTYGLVEDGNTDVIRKLREVGDR
ncbi:hypothetical protein F4560_008474 [Saccharothrix ecbatanensis]|uniref:PE domain-containing protein n=1 Tax=Saccharothrix ecbatanensis TaxID=1105145 RepID=A0A7W9M601_9PSEU|nr:PE domain-containing protein [Saccharothrix ecbatanensis]MBB5808706.1 hypothetical protein [Saccharothrix ecbatanensis]